METIMIPERHFEQFEGASKERFKAVSEYHLAIIEAVRKGGLTTALAIAAREYPDRGKAYIRREAQWLVRCVKKSDAIHIPHFVWNGVTYGVLPNTLLERYEYAPLFGEEKISAEEFGGYEAVNAAFAAVVATANAGKWPYHH